MDKENGTKGVNIFRCSVGDEQAWRSNRLTMVRVKTLLLLMML